MTVSGEVCSGYFKCFNKLWTDEELCDFTVQICDVSIKCHRVILGACSPFFLGLLRSGMKEANEGRVVLQDISVSTFQLILKTLYTGEDVLSLENFIEIWHAVDMLQIGFLVELCETFAAKNIKLENFTRILSSAKLLDSKLVLTLVRNFMVQNIKAIHESKSFVQISSDEMICLIGRQDLNFTSEYSVLEFVLDWIDFKDSQPVNSCTGNNKKLKTTVPVNTLLNNNANHNMLRSCLKDDIGPENKCDATNNKQESNQPNSKQLDNLCCNSKTTTSENLSSDRFDQLNTLLSQVRICTISPGMLMNFLEHRLVKRNDEARQTIISAILKQSSFRHGQWPTAGIYRQFHEYGNYGVYLVKGQVSVELFDPFDEKLYKLKLYNGNIENVQLVAFNNELYATGVRLLSSHYNNLYVYSYNKWTHLAEITKSKHLLASNEQHIYITSVGGNVIYQFDPKCKPPIIFSTLPKDSVPRQVMSYKIYLIYICTEKVNRIEETAIHMLDLLNKSWTRLDNLDGPADNIISFRNDHNYFLLQTNGNLWTLNENADNITFIRIAKLWRQELILYGAVVYGEKLVISYNNSENNPNDSFVYTLDNMFRIIRYWKIESCCSNFIPCVLNKSCLSEYSNQRDHLAYDSYSDISD